MSGVKIKTIKGGKERTITYKRILLKLRHCDKASAFAGLAEVDRVLKMSDTAFETEFNSPSSNKFIYTRNIQRFIRPCHINVSIQHLKEMVQKLPKKLSGWVGVGIKIVYNVKKERGQGIEIRYNDGDVEFWKVIEEYK